MITRPVVVIGSWFDIAHRLGKRTGDCTMSVAVLKNNARGNEVCHTRKINLVDLILMSALERLKLGSVSFLLCELGASFE